MRSLPSLMALEPKDCMPVSKQASLPSSMPRSQSIALIGIDGLLTKIRAYSPHKNKENSHAMQQLETITFLGGAVTDFLPIQWKDAPSPKCPKTIQKISKKLFS